jgi:hypothetical protein
MGSLLPFFVTVAVCLRPFNERGYRCNGNGGGWPGGRVYGSNGLQQITTRELRRPQFFACPENYTRDHLVELQVAKAYLLKDAQNSLSCKTINWLNTRANVYCVPRELNALKGQWFREVLTLQDQGCDPKLHDVVSQVCWSGGGNTTCKKNQTCDGITIGQQDCCCHLSIANIDEERDKSVFWKALKHKEKFEPEVRDDLLELQRFLSYKAVRFCGHMTTTTSTTQSPSTKAATASPHANVSVFEMQSNTKKKKKIGNKSRKKKSGFLGGRSGAKSVKPRRGTGKGGNRKSGGGGTKVSSVGRSGRAWIGRQFGFGRGRR